MAFLSERANTAIRSLVSEAVLAMFLLREAEQRLTSVDQQLGQKDNEISAGEARIHALEDELRILRSMEAPHKVKDSKGREGSEV